MTQAKAKKRKASRREGQKHAAQEPRDDEQRARDACNNWMRWQGLIGHLGVADRRVLFDVAYGRVEPMGAGLVTAQGTRFVLAVERLADVIEAGNIS